MWKKIVAYAMVMTYTACSVAPKALSIVSNAWCHNS